MFEDAGIENVKRTAKRSFSDADVLTNLFKKFVIAARL
jgi:hypothetical protein